MTSSAQTKTIQAKYLFASPLVFSFLCFVQLPGQDALSRTSFDNPAAFLIAYLVAGVATYLLFVVVPKLRTSDTVHIPALISILPIVAGMGLSFLFDAAHFGSDIQIPAGGALIGIGSALLFMSWGQAFSRIDSRALIPTTAAMFAVAYLLKLAFTPLSATHFNLAIIGCAIIVSALPLDSLLGNRAERLRGEGATEDVAIGLKQALTSLWKPLFGCVLCCMVWGFSWGNSLQGVVVHAADPVSIPFSDIGKIGAALFLLAYGLKRPIDFSRGLLLPIAAGCLLLGWMLSSLTGDIALVAIDIISALGFAVFEIALWIKISEVAAGKPAFSRLLFALTRTVFAGTIILGIGIAPLLGQQLAELFTPICTVLFFILYATSTSRTNTRTTHSDLDSLRADGSPEAPRTRRSEAARPADATLPALCEEFGLSPRESEVFLMFVKGHSATYISEQLVVSPHTVKTHIKRVYEKVGVHSKDELIALCTQGQPEHIPLSCNDALFAGE